MPAVAISAWIGQLAVVATLASTYKPRQWLTGFSDEYDKVHVNDTLSVTRTLSAPPHPFRCCVYRDLRPYAAECEREREANHHEWIIHLLRSLYSFRERVT